MSKYEVQPVISSLVSERVSGKWQQKNFAAIFLQNHLIKQLANQESPVNYGVHISRQYSVTCTNPGFMYRYPSTLYRSPSSQVQQS